MKKIVEIFITAIITAAILVVAALAAVNYIDTKERAEHRQLRNQCNEQLFDNYIEPEFNRVIKSSFENGHTIDIVYIHNGYEYTYCGVDEDQLANLLRAGEIDDIEKVSVGQFDVNQYMWRRR